MVSTSASKDLYQRFVNPAASDSQLLRVGRGAAVAGGTVGVLLSIWLQTVTGAVTIFYSLLVVTLFVPIVGGLYSPRAGAAEAMSAIATGVTTLFVVRFAVAAATPWLDPTLAGILAAAAVFLSVRALRRIR
jgi:SSS family solute:Na+ symporter